MKKFLFVVVLAGFMLSAVSPAFAVKQLKDAFVAEYSGDKANEDFKKLVEEASCNVCHVDKENKKNVRNPYGEALLESMKKDDFPVKDFAKDPAKFAERLKVIFKAVEEGNSGYEDHKTFAARMKASLLPGGDVKGKKQ
jgi:hypothetical protein